MTTTTSEPEQIEMWNESVRVRIPGELLWGTVVDRCDGYDCVRLENEPLCDELGHGDIIWASRSEYVDARGVATYELKGDLAVRGHQNENGR